jgi:hypothetical protein
MRKEIRDQAERSEKGREEVGLGQVRVPFQDQECFQSPSIYWKPFCLRNVCLFILVFLKDDVLFILFLHLSFLSPDSESFEIF